VVSTQPPFRNSWVGCGSLPAGPLPLIPNRLLSCVARELWPHPDSSIACAIVTAAGTPYLLCAATAPGATASMNACSAELWLARAGPGRGWCRR
jgi:hypothetical protein